MDKEEIFNGNTLIANFMGLDGYRKIDGTTVLYEDNSGLGQTVTTADKLFYESNWNKLMPVVEKIAYIESCFLINIYKQHTFCIIKDGINDIDKNINTISISAVWLTVVDYIKCYNNKNK